MLFNIHDKMKHLFYILLIFSAVQASSQNISGIYSGTLTNDSLKMVQNYELALSEYRGKITGYSYITFVSNDTFYYGIKRIKATRQNGELVVEDVEMLANNYPKRPDKGVHVINRIPLPAGQDTILDMNGRWETTKTKKFYSISGAMSLRRDDDSSHSPLVAHLKELQVVNYQEEKKENMKTVAKTEIKEKPKEPIAQTTAFAQIKHKETLPAVKSSEENKSKEVAVKEMMPKENVSGQNTESLIATRRDTKPKEVISPQAKPSVDKPSAIQVTSTTAVKENNDVSLSPGTKTVFIPVEQMKAKSTPVNQPAAQTNDNPQKMTSISSPAEKVKAQQTVSKEFSSDTKSKEQKPAMVQASIASPEIKKEVAQPVKNDASAPTVLAERVNNTMQTIAVTSDSLVLTFYDNGIVDGDSISVYLNNENIISKVKITEAAVKKTIYINGNEDAKVTLVAESLGSIPPNTGLLIIQDGNQRYNIRFSADMQTNASVIIKKKR